MSDKVFAIITISVSGIFALLVAIVTHWLASSRESRVFVREARRDRIQMTRELYEEAIFILDRSCRTLGLGSQEDREQTIRFIAKLSLHATQAVQEQYFKTADVLDEWVAQARKGQPERHGGVLVVKSGSGREEVTANSMWPRVEQSLNELKSLMRIHLAELEDGSVAGND